MKLTSKEKEVVLMAADQIERRQATYTCINLDIVEHQVLGTMGLRAAYRRFYWETANIPLLPFPYWPGLAHDTYPTQDQIDHRVMLLLLFWAANGEF